MRRRPLLRAAAVGGGAYLAGKRSQRRQSGQEYQQAGQDQQVSDLEQQQRQQPASQPAGQPESMSGQLSQLAEMHQQGVLTDDEFAAAKAKLLGT